MVFWELGALVYCSFHFFFFLQAVIGTLSKKFLLLTVLFGKIQFPVFFRLLTTLPLLNFPAANYQGKLTYCFSCILGKTTILPTTTIEKRHFPSKLITSSMRLQMPFDVININ